MHSQRSTFIPCDLTYRLNMYEHNVSGSLFSVDSDQSAIARITDKDVLTEYTKATLVTTSLEFGSNQSTEEIAIKQYTR